MAETKIEWTDRTWNPVRGCSRVSPGCDNCYAMKVAHRFSNEVLGKPAPYQGLTVLRPKTAKRPGVDWSGVVRFVPDMLEEPFAWASPQLVFVNSMSDLFHESLSREQIAEVFGVMAVCATKFGGKYKPHVGWVKQRGPHTFQVLTKRPNVARALLLNPNFRRTVASAAYRWAMDRVDAGWLQQCISGVREWGNHCTLDPMWPLPNVWLGASVENRAALHRVDDLRETPAAVRFLSIEPLLEDLGTLDLRGIDWVIVGGESGAGARPFHFSWLLAIVKQCADAGVACFVKQIGACPIRSDGQGFAITHRKGGDMSEWPESLRVRQFPEVRRGC